MGCMFSWVELVIKNPARVNKLVCMDKSTHIHQRLTLKVHIAGLKIDLLLPDNINNQNIQSLPNVSLPRKSFDLERLPWSRVVHRKC